MHTAPGHRRRLTWTVLLVGVLIALSGSAVAAALPAAGPAAPNNSTQHENPDTVNEGGDLDGLSDALADRVASQLGDSAIELSQGEYDRARDLVGADTRSTFGKFVDVAGETDGEADDATVEEAETARENQQDLVNATQEYRETYEAYRTAKANGNETRARRLARELDRLAEDVRENGTQVERSYRNLSELTGTDLSEARAAINATVENVTDTQADVRAATFVQTRLTVRVESRTVSFTQPLTLQGRLTTANGSAVANRTVAIDVGERTLTTETNATGHFDLRYRPTTLPVATEPLTVRYVPDPASVYLGATTTVPVSVDQVQPTVSVTRTPAAVGFGDRLTVSGRVAAADVGAPGVPLVVSVDGEQVGRTTTEANGSYRLSTAVPAAVRDGQRQVRVRVAMTDRALAAADGRRRVTVEPTPSTVTVTATQAAAGGTMVVVRGRVTGAGQGVPSTLVALAIGGTDVGSVRTNATGHFETTVGAAATLEDPNGTVTRAVVARYDGAETSLQPSNATTTVQLSFPPGNGADGSGADGSGTGGPGAAVWAVLVEHPFVAGGVGVLLIGGLVAAGVLLWRRRPDAESGGQIQDQAAAPGGDVDAEPTDALPALEAARAHLSAGAADDAVLLGYAAVRGALPEAERSQSHWEFYRAVAADGYDADRVAALRELTEGYERAAFAPCGVDTAEAAAALEAATRTLDRDAASAAA